jgi:hypothetical protein
MLTHAWQHRWSHDRWISPPLLALSRQIQSVRHGSLAADFQLTLVQIATLISYFDARLAVHQAAQLSSLLDHRHTVSKLYAAMRVRCRAYLTAHPIRYPVDEIVEVDEIFIGALRTRPNREGEGGEV